MVTTNKKDKVLIQQGDEIIELTGSELEAFEKDRKEIQKQVEKLETELKAKQEKRENAIKKLAEIAGLTDEEIAAII